MDRPTVDGLITRMLASADRVSDLLFIVGKPALVESDGRLIPFAINASGAPLTLQFIQALAELIIDKDERLSPDYASTGPADCSYAIENVARFRVNIYRENNRRAIVMRTLQAAPPTLASLGLPPVFQQNSERKKWDRASYGRDWFRKNDDLGRLD